MFLQKFPPSSFYLGLWKQPVHTHSLSPAEFGFTEDIKSGQNVVFSVRQSPYAHGSISL